MSGHSTASDSSRAICDALFSQLKELVPEIKRSEKSKPCAFHHPDHNRFAYVYHSKGSNLIFFRGRHKDDASKFSSHFGINKREKLGGNWQKDFPFSFTMHDTSGVTDISRFLIDYSYPLAQRKAKLDRIVRRSDRTLPEEVLPTKVYREGTIESINVNRYERDPNARKACIDQYGAICCVCGFCFSDVFGEVMSGFIHVHHLKPLSKIGRAYEVDPIRDMRPVCPNCHAVLHRREPPYSIEEIQRLINENKRV